MLDQIKYRAVCQFDDDVRMFEDAMPTDAALPADDVAAVSVCKAKVLDVVNAMNQLRERGIQVSWDIQNQPQACVLVKFTALKEMKFEQ